MTAGLRFLGNAWFFHLRQIATIKIYVFDSVVLPLILATMAIRWIGDDADVTTATSVTLGAAIMGMWAATLSGTGGAINRFRSMGLLEPIVAAPTPLAIALAANALASATLGLYSVTTTLLWARYGLDAPIAIDSIPLLTAAVLVTIISTAGLGLLLSVSLVLFPRGQSVSTLFEYPLWILTGAMIPLDLLPDWVEKFSRVIGPAWGMTSIRAAAAGDIAAFGPAIGYCLLVTAFYWTIAVVLLRSMESRAREKATLPLS